MYKNAFLKNNSKAIKEALNYEASIGEANLSILLASYEGVRMNKDYVGMSFIEREIEKILEKYKNKIQNGGQKGNS